MPLLRHCPIAIYPRKGTKTYLPPSLAYGSYSTIPVRGRKRCIPTTYQSHVSTIPVRGRKLVRPAVNRCNVGTIPVRGRKLTTHGANAQTATLQFIPARGQKSTSATGVCQQRRCFAFSYILFYRLGAAPDGIVFVTGSALTPCGTFRFKVRISCR